MLEIDSTISLVTAWRDIGVLNLKSSDKKSTDLRSEEHFLEPQRYRYDSRWIGILELLTCAPPATKQDIENTRYTYLLSVDISGEGLWIGKSSGLWIGKSSGLWIGKSSGHFLDAFGLIHTMHFDHTFL